MTSLNSPGFSLTLLNLSLISKSVSSIEELLGFIDAPHASASWPTSSVYSTPEALRNRTRAERFIDVPRENEHVDVVVDGAKLHGKFNFFLNSSTKLLISCSKVTPETLISVLKYGAQEVYDAEPDLTRWDTVSASVSATYDSHNLLDRR